MNELIPIQQHEGKSVVSARDLHSFLEDKQHFADWIKKRIAKYGLIEGQDYITVHNIMNGGKFAPTEYALTMDAAKELSMVQANAKGQEARRYFIAREEQLRKIEESAIVVLTPAEQLLAQAQQLVNQERRLSHVESKVDQILAIQQEAAQRLLEVPRSNSLLPEQTTRSKVQQIVNGYCNAFGLEHAIIWRKIYDRLYYIYHISIRAYKRSDRESLLDVAERTGHMEKIYAIASAELKYDEYAGLAA